MKKGLVFGKFYPFHKGHEAMIKFALTHCDYLIVLVCCSDKEIIPSGKRTNWIRTTFDKYDNVDVRAFNYNENNLPNTSESSEDVSKIWSEIFKVEVPDCAVLITSEAYGYYVAEFMGIEHIEFDPKRSNVAVSATAIRTDLLANWNFLPDSVKPDFAIRVVILGTECTGKTTLTEMLAKHYNCSFVKEAGREFVANSNSIELNDLNTVAAEHATYIDKALIGQSPLIIIDTDIHITQSYARFALGQTLDINESVYNTNKANLYLYLTNDVDYVQDGTRLNETDRAKLDISHKDVLNEYNIDFIEVSGNWNQRFEKSIQEIDYLISSIKSKYRSNQ
jgi:HTH-type transcriptional repressor of NAD biosynthesis genes